VANDALLLAEIKKTNERLSAVDSLLRSAQGPASRVGMTPEQFIARGTGGGSMPMIFGNDGAMLPFSYDPHGKHLGKDFAQFLQASAVATFPSKFSGVMQPQEAHNRLKKIEEDADRFYRDTFGTTKAALAEGSGVTGGYTVPPMFSNQILYLALEDSIVTPRASKMPMTSLTLQIPTLDVTTAQAAGTTAILGGITAKWSAESQTRSESEPKVRQTELKAHELSFYAVASNTLLADQAVALDTLLTQLFSFAIGWFTDYAYFQGNGVGQPVGMINAPATIAVNRAAGAGTSTFSYADAVTMMSKMYGLLLRGKSLVWVIHQSVLPKLFQMTDAAGRLVFIPIDKGAQDPIPQSAGLQSFGWLFGIPVMISEKVPALGTKGDVGLYDCSKYILGQRMDLQIDVSPHVNFLTNQMVWRVLWRGDGQPWLNGPITLADGTFQVSVFVVLN
jgi:HK97 family phage major capsid protein